jgi:hypothetical protein
MTIRFDRLERVAAYLARKMESSSFDMGFWSSREQRIRQGQCGFAGCAMGWVAHRKMFRGFKLGMVGGIGPIPLYYGAENYQAVAKLFGITGDDAHALFGVYGDDPTPKGVAKHIRAFIRRKKAQMP